MKFGKIKTYAHRLLAGQPIPIFVDNSVNRAIEAHVRRIVKAKTHRRGSK